MSQIQISILLDWVPFKRLIISLSSFFSGNILIKLKIKQSTLSAQLLEKSATSECHSNENGEIFAPFSITQTIKYFACCEKETKIRRKTTECDQNLIFILGDLKHDIKLKITFLSVMRSIWWIR